MNEKTKNLLVRTATGVVFVAVMIEGMLRGRLPFAILLLAITAGCMWELYGLAEKAGVAPHKALGMLIGLLVVGANLGLVEAVVNSVGFVKYVGISVVLVILLGALVPVLDLWRKRGSAMSNVGATFLGVAYIALPVSLIALLPLVGGKMLLTWNPLVVLAYILVVWANDVFAYLAGITIGRHKLCERLSPKKTWEGFFGGLVGAVGVAALIGGFAFKFRVGGGVWLWAGLGVLIAVSSVLGDLVESHFKRSVGAKDSGRLLPGHGGLLDRFDAVLVSASFVFIFFVIVALVDSATIIQNFF
ncbi:MAG: phosphatidate cytidylyltransferase [Rikenellaceae bacterium]|jgi:phosphatidate cytidylyltransferase|nr:phosphatidate cytidylyltransferase [Rikenellaceae bacterium]